MDHTPASSPVRPLLFVALLAALLPGASACHRPGTDADPCPLFTRAHGRAPPDGTLQWCARRDGTKHGPWREWHANGALKTEGAYVDGKMEGRWTSYFDTGVKLAEGEYRGGLKRGVWTQYYEEGQKNREEVHAEGAPVRWTAWRSDGQVWAEGTLVGHLPQGAYAEWHPNGTLAAKGEYTQGRRAGAWKFFRADGTPSDAPQGDFGED